MNPTQAIKGREPIKLRPLLRGLVVDFEVMARARHVKLDPLVFLEKMDGDAGLLRQLLVELVGAALRRAPTGTTVTVVVSQRERGAEFRIADEGAGMSGVARAQALEAAATYGGALSVTETDDGTVVCLAFPAEPAAAPAGRLVADETATRELATTEPALARRPSGIYARADPPASAPVGVDASRDAWASGRET